MNIKNLILGYTLTLLVFLIVDMIWLGFVAKGLYRKYLGSFLSDSVNWSAAIIFYLIFILGISIFVIYPAIHKNSLLNAIAMGALFGIFTYATYDLTNLATLKGWPLPIVFIDMIWGAALSAFVGGAGFLIVKWLN